MTVRKGYGHHQEFVDVFDLSVSKLIYEIIIAS